LEDTVEFDNKEIIEKISKEVISRLRSSGFSQSSFISKDDELRKIAKMIDHTILKADATYDEVKQICSEAIEYGFASVCVNPGFVALVSEMLKGSGIPTCSVVGFPLGATTSKAKAFETREAIENGAKEIDMVINISALKSKDYNRVRSDIGEVVIAARNKAKVKVIIETCLLTDDEKIRACELAKEAGADFVKTSTGFSTGGAKVEDIRLMRKTVGPDMGVKASGGVSDYSSAKALLEAGACTLGDSDICRIGTSKSINIVTGK
jgi:deoxyribose-phosphate aldolase